MNAKERRKLLRQQQQKSESEEPVKQETPIKAEGQGASEAAVKVEKKTKAEPVAEPAKAPAAAKLNAKERRKLMREQQRVATGESASGKDEGKKEASGDALGAKRQQRKAGGSDSQAEKDAEQIGKKRKRKVKANEAEDGEQDAKRKRIHLTLFVGQLPFKCTEKMVRDHFAEAGEITLRMLTDKKTGKFKGTAFIEVKDSKALGAALSRHHTLLNGRRINVELTASGGGNKSEQRRGKIDGLRKKQSEKQIEKTRALVQKYIDAPDSKLKAEDVDDRMIDFLSWFDYATAKNALEEYNRCVSDRVKNTKAFFMGILKRFRSTDGAE